MPGTASSPAMLAPKRHKPLWLKIIIGIVLVFVVLPILLFIILSAIVGVQTAAPLKVSDSFVADMQADNAADAYALTNDAFQKATSQNALQTLFDSAKALTGKPSVTDRAISTSTANGTVAVFLYTINDTSGTKYYLKTEVKEDGSSWKVVNFRISASTLTTGVE